MFYFTSFHNIDFAAVNANVYSIVRWQPKACHLEVLPFFVSQISLARCHYNLEDYATRVQRLLTARAEAINAWLGNIDHTNRITLVCYCPNAISSTKQMEIYDGRFMCHGMVVSMYLSKLGYEVEWDESRENDAIQIDSNFMPYVLLR